MCNSNSIEKCKNCVFFKDEKCDNDIDNKNAQHCLYYRECNYSVNLLDLQIQIYKNLSFEYTYIIILDEESNIKQICDNIKLLNFPPSNIIILRTYESFLPTEKELQSLNIPYTILLLAEDIGWYEGFRDIEHLLKSWYYIDNGNYLNTLTAITLIKWHLYGKMEPVIAAMPEEGIRGCLFSLAAHKYLDGHIPIFLGDKLEYLAEKDSEWKSRILYYQKYPSL